MGWAPVVELDGGGDLGTSGVVRGASPGKQSAALVRAGKVQ